MPRIVLLSVSLIFAQAAFGQSSGVEQGTTSIPLPDRSKACEEALANADAAVTQIAVTQGSVVREKKKCDCVQEKNERWTCIGWVSWKKETK